MSQRTADTVIHAGWIVPVAPRSEVLQNHSLAISGDRIAAILPTDQATDIAADAVLELPGHALMPGLVNCHGHAAMSLLRGYADDLALEPWLEQKIWPAEARHVDARFVADGVELAIAEMIRSGTTCFSDMYFFPDATARVAIETGMRCQISFPVLDFPTAWAANGDEYISKGLALRDNLKQSQLVTVIFGPHATYTVAEENLQKVATYAAELDLPIQIHLHETTTEVSRAETQWQESPLTRLNRLGLLGPKTQCVHMTALTDEEMNLVAATGAHVVHCPQSNMKLASGTCPVTRLQSRGINVALGTDGAASNNDLNMFGEIQAAALLAKLSTADATALNASAVLEMATLNGARALGIAGNTGSLESGKQADVIAVDLSGPETQPLYNVLSQLVYACNGSQVSHSWINGRAVMAERQLLSIDSDDLARRIMSWQQSIAAGNDDASAGWRDIGEDNE